MVLAVVLKRSAAGIGIRGKFEARGWEELVFEAILRRSVGAPPASRATRKPGHPSAYSAIQNLRMGKLTTTASRVFTTEAMLLASAGPTPKVSVQKSVT